MRKILAALLVAFALSFTAIAPAQTNDEITLSWRYKTDGRGHNYGLNFSTSNLSSTPVCVEAYVDSTSYNVTGEVTPRFNLSPGQTLYIGEVTQYDPQQAWLGHVTEQWHSGYCN
jgi:hypothetical protein